MTQSPSGTPPDPSNNTPPSATPAAFVEDPAKTPEENAAAKAAFEKAAADATAAEANDTKKNPFKPEELKFSDGFQVDAPIAEKFTTLINEMGLTRENVSKLTSFYEEVAKANSGKDSEAWQTLQTSWQNEVKADPTIGGTNLPLTQTHIGRVLDKYGDEAARQAFDLTGAGNNPAIVRLMAKIGKDISEAPLVPGNTPPVTKPSLAEMIYDNPTSRPQQGN